MNVLTWSTTLAAVLCALSGCEQSKADPSTPNVQSAKEEEGSLRAAGPAGSMAAPLTRPLRPAPSQDR